jgi:hypothetical protein
LFEEPLLNAFDDYMYDLSILTRMGKQALPYISNEKKLMITGRYEEVSLAEVREQTRMMCLILRNLVFVQTNDLLIFRHEKCFELLLKLFFNCVDSEITKYVVEVMSILCKYLIIPKLAKSCERKFMPRLIEFLNSDSFEEYEAALECMHNLMLS